MSTTHPWAIGLAAFLAVGSLPACSGEAESKSGQSGNCTQQLEAYCDPHTCLAHIPDGPEGLRSRAVAAYCADPVLKECITGASSCESSDGSTAYVEIELARCDPYLLVYYAKDSGELVSVLADKESVCASTVFLAGVYCAGTGIFCGPFEPPPDAGSDEVNDS